jgi:SAM-dependent methyltransferase
MGASAVGADLSDNAVAAAKDLAKELNADADFVCCNIYDLPQHLHQTFDIVFTSYGTIGWLPDLDRWAEVIHHFLKPGGEFIFVEFHPVVWMFDDLFERIIYSYFKRGAIVENETGTYADRNSSIQQQSVSWNHSMSEVVTSLLKFGLQIKSLNEYPYSPYNCFRRTIEESANKFQIAHLKDKLPMVYAIKATKTF